AHRLTTWATALRITLQIVRRPDDLHTFTVLPRRWVVERTFAWISKQRRTVRDYETLPASHEAMILWAMIALMTRRLAHTTQLSAPHLAPWAAAGPRAGGTVPRAAATNSSSAGPARPSAPASSTAVSLCAVRLKPRSKLLTARGDTPAAAASSSWVSLASARSCRSSPAKESTGCPVTIAVPPHNLSATATGTGRNQSCPNSTQAPALPP